MLHRVNRWLATPARRTSAGYVIALIYCILAALIWRVPVRHVGTAMSPWATDISLVTWGSWVVANATAVAYGVIVIHDMFFTLIALLNVVCCAAVTAVCMQRRRGPR